ncbi:NAD(P)/FAD-dependent oxidoreductase [Amycolatopsis umgeniensis]|uniref:NADPH-dependent 2,4-dienoyl-CoA reductase/sulfur reductase-like enzyme n=1 Tax=Amycolatopsis umgeniensis TaxID=336628 RepID=A0A841B0V5_9PSEU|nr:FAD-dependent oxidoreductase [Amycolatopsis umgeniensis]MBB5852703.1 NADPH-dependent 2,4-dienoyl-CoA reductase/sulfur reductase-like enzyme [Amycolatopsis umgeniensis]
MRTVAVVGTSLAGLRAAQELRGRGFDGRLVMIGAEPPYDRPPLSKDFLLGKVSAEDLALAGQDDLAALDAEWHLGVRAERLGAAGVTLEDGTTIAADGYVVATGAAARTLDAARKLNGVHTLRTLDDAVSLKQGLAAGPGSVVVIGAGFIGAEVASACRLLGHDVTVIEAMPVPLAPVIGPEMGTVCAGLHAEGDVRLIAGVPVAGFAGADRVTGVRLADGREIPADLVVAGVGARPATEWLTGSGLAVDDGVLVDSGCVTANPRVIAVGDVARYRCRLRGRRVRAEHWTAANEQAGVAVANLLAGETVTHFARHGYFWSDQYGRRLQFAGVATEDVRIVEGDVASKRFVATYHRGESLAGVFAIDSPRPFTRLRRAL